MIIGKEVKIKTLKAISLETSLWTKLHQISKKEGRSISKVIEELLIEVIQRRERNESKKRKSA